MWCEPIRPRAAQYTNRRQWTYTSPWAGPTSALICRRVKAADPSSSGRYGAEGRSSRSHLKSQQPISIQWPFGRADYAHSQTPKKLHRICHDKVTRSGSRHQPTTKHNLQYRTVPYEYDYQLGNQYERLRYEYLYSYDCFFVRFRFTQCKYVTKSTVLVRTRVFRRRLPVTDRQTHRQTHTRDVKSGGCTDNAKRTTQDSLRKKHEIGQSPPAHPKA